MLETPPSPPLEEHRYKVESYLTPKRRQIRWVVVKLTRTFNVETREIVSRHTSEAEARSEASALSFQSVKY
jgi:hypothetical protein